MNELKHSAKPQASAESRSTSANRMTHGERLRLRAPSLLPSQERPHDR